MRFLKIAAILVAIFAVGFFARPASAAHGCDVSPDSSEPVGTVFGIYCDGFSPNTYVNIYAVEPDGRASGINLYGFFPTTVKTDETGTASLYFATEYPGYYSAPVGNYTFVVQQLGIGGIAIKEEVYITVESRAEANSSAYLDADVDDYVVSFYGWGFSPYEQANVWVTQPDGARCSGLGIDQLSLAALGADSSSLWYGPGTVKASAVGEVSFTMVFDYSACIGEYVVTVATPSRNHAAEAAFSISGNSVTETGGAYIEVLPDTVAIYGSSLSIHGWGFPGGAGVNCWFTRPDGRVISFFNQNVTADASGSFTTGAVLDDFSSPPYTSTEPGKWYATCATPSRSALAIDSFVAAGPELDP